MRADAFDGRLDFWLLVHRQGIEDDDIAGPERRHQHLLDIGEQRRIVEGAIEDRRGVHAIDAQRGDPGVRVPMAARRVIT